MKNCWEKNQCGREPGGINEARLGTCPVAVYQLADGFLGGKNGGRACIFIVGALASPEMKSTCAAIQQNESTDCFQCHFFHALNKKYKKAFNIEIFNRYIQNAMTLSLE